jgi:RNA polymerase sigma factor (sigma-70 family)
MPSRSEMVVIPFDPGRGAHRTGAGAPPRGEGQELEPEILDALDRGDRDRALDLLMHAYGRSLHSYCRQMLPDADLADEVHQMTFVQAYEGLFRFARRSSLRTWLFGIAHHRCLDTLKITRRRERRFELRAELPDQPAPVGTAEDRLTALSRVRDLARCLRELAPRVRDAVLLRYQQGITYDEMARLCGERPATLQARVARSLPVLRRCLEREGGDR